jgi:SAM-dependent methyltransferase
MDKTRIKDFADKVYADTAGAMAVAMADVGTRTGLFRAMSGAGPVRAEALAEATGLNARYVAEWLAGMASAGYLDYDSTAETFALPDEHAFLLASEGTDHFMGGLFRFTPVLMSMTGQVAEAFRTGGGVRFEDFPDDLIPAIDLSNAGTYDQRLTSYWLAQLPDVVARLEGGGRALDVGCGAGRVPMTIARAWPGAEVVGLDPDSASITEARRAAGEAGLDHVTFIDRTTTHYSGPGGFALVTLMDVLHDLPDPVATLREIRALMAEDGALFVMEPKAADTLDGNMHALGTVYYGFSLFHCMTQSLANGGPGHGTCMGPAKTRALLAEAGFTRIDDLPIRSATNLFYAARA